MWGITVTECNQHNLCGTVDQFISGKDRLFQVCQVCLIGICHVLQDGINKVGLSVNLREGKIKAEKIKAEKGDEVMGITLRLLAVPISDIKSVKHLNIVGGKRTKKCQRSRH
jgi:hypothetical protein